MKRLLSLFAACLFVAASYADLTEDFNSLTGGTWSSETDVTLPSGRWTFGGGAQYNQSSGVKSVKFNANGAYMITPQVDSIGAISFKYRSGGSSKQVEVAWQQNGGAWQVVDTLRIASSSSSFSSYQHDIPADSLSGVRIRIKGITSNVYVDDVVLTRPEPQQPGEVIPGEPDPEFTRPTFVATHATYYISPAGNDQTGDGSFENPWYNLGKAVSVAQAGDVIYCRGGRYLMSWRGTDSKLTVRLTQSGTAEEPIVISAYENEAPIFDFEQQLLDCGRNKNNVGDRGLLITGNYWILFGLHITHAADNGIKLEGSHNRIERCEFCYNLDTGLQLGFGHNFADAGFGVSSNDGSYCAYNDVVDCDSHHNCDFDSNYGSDADGFACKMHNGIGNRFIRCRAWRNSDDAWDLYETDFDVILIECWAWESGKAADHQWVKTYLDGNASFSGNGNGIKLGGNGTGGSSKGIHYAYRCVAFGCNNGSSVKGFDCNSHKGGHVIINCLAFDNSYDYMFESGGSHAKTYYYNNVCFGSQEISVGTDDYNAMAVPDADLAWSHHLVTGFTRADYVSLSEADALAPRRGDGSMPARFARLKPNSSLIDAGCDVPAAVTPNLPQLQADYPFIVDSVYGTARDMGPYEFRRVDSTSTAVQQIIAPESLGALDILQGNDETERILRFSVPADGSAQIAVYALSGRVVYRRQVTNLAAGVEYYYPLDVTAFHGMHVVHLLSGHFHTAAKLVAR